MPSGDWGAGEKCITSLPGREADFRASVVQALDYVQALGTERQHANG
jgi:2-dehydrotetronate isomerase